MNGAFSVFGRWHLPLEWAVYILAVASAAVLIWLYVLEVRRARKEHEVTFPWRLNAAVALLLLIAVALTGPPPWYLGMAIFFIAANLIAAAYGFLLRQEWG